MAQINVAELYKETRLKLKLNWVAGLDGGTNQLNSENVTKPSLALIGHLKLCAPQPRASAGLRRNGLFA